VNIDLTGKTAVIVGGSGGLGEAMAYSLSEAGASIALVARNASKLATIRNTIARNGGKVDFFTADVTEEAEVEQIRGQINDRFGAPQILINSAGVNIRKNLVDFTLAEFRSVVDSSLISTFLACRAFVPGMMGRGYGRIINMTSIMAHISLPGRTAYSSAKASLLGFTKSLALELADQGVTVNGISPGPFGTEMNAPVMNNPEANRQFLASLPVGRWGRVEEIGALACYLCSEQAGFITGADILIDGGWTAK
jgi:NAD(P)-dependent dehydrogenase (short-subunit alcohol dehydrogenase family)